VTAISDFLNFRSSTLRGFFLTTCDGKSAMAEGAGAGLMQQSGQDLAHV